MYLKKILMGLILGLGISLIANQAKAQETVQKQVEEMPVPPGGMEGFTKYMIENLKYPAAAKEANIQGMVMVTFVVRADGSVDTIEVLRGIGGGCDEEAVRVVAESGKWTPGKNGGKAVATQMTLPIQFKI
ncbi:TonB family protein [Algoriphagus boseongensis]|uniref:TonB family protein n=1 Tax=Algoriphagus boseongensis TaxID=1442587 RepID=A0A4V3D2K7_9BACT|nr:energy transducer TonB [Algoriphagus boseongensis]TDQ19257.1 TonB family protein [Algoriphagus boseongensis]